MKYGKQKELTLHEDISNEENGDCCVVLDAFQVEVFLQSIEASLWQGVPVEVVQEVY
jgi:hypothetical protein